MGFDFLTRFSELVDVLGMKDAQVYAGVPHLVSGASGKQPHAGRKRSRLSNRAVANWPKSGQYKR